MKKYASIILVVLLVLSWSALLAQPGTARLSLQYNYGIPLGGFKNSVVSDGSPRGFTGDLAFALNYKWALGAGIGFQDYYQKYDRTVYDLDKNQQVSAVLSNSIQVVPLLFKAYYTPLGGTGFLQPYLSAGAGIGFITNNQYLGEFSSYHDSKGRLAASGEAGVMVPFKRRDAGVSFLVGATYNYVDFKEGGSSNLSNIGVHAGFTFLLR